MPAYQITLTTTVVLDVERTDQAAETFLRQYPGLDPDVLHVCRGGADFNQLEQLDVASWDPPDESLTCVHCGQQVDIVNGESCRAHAYEPYNDLPDDPWFLGLRDKPIGS